MDPGISIPSLLVFRWPSKLYHTNADNMNAYNENNFFESIDYVMELLKMLENEIRVVNVKRGIINLSKNQLWDDYGNGKDRRSFEITSLMDISHSYDEIKISSGFSGKGLDNLVKKLEQKVGCHMSELDLKSEYEKDYFSKRDSDNRRMLSYQIEYEKILSYVKGGSVLDIGCGLGEFLELFGKDWNKYGIEISQYASSISERKNIKMIDFDFDFNSMDLIIFRGTIQHLDKPLWSIKNV